MSNVELLNTDCMAYMATLPDKAFDLAIVDPPYGIGASGSFGHYWDSTKGAPATNGLRNVAKNWDKATPSAEYWLELFRVSHDQIVWGGNYFTDHLPVSRGWIGWDKKQPETSSFSMLELAWSSMDCVCNMFRMYSTHVTQGVRIHPTQKPVKLYEWLLTNYAKPGQRILDTHLGSGSSAIAAHNLGFDFVGMELDADYYAAACKRFEQHKAQGSLFEPEPIQAKNIQSCCL